VSSFLFIENKHQATNTHKSYTKKTILVGHVRTCHDTQQQQQQKSSGAVEWYTTTGYNIDQAIIQQLPSPPSSQYGDSVINEDQQLISPSSCLSTN
jgi:hypothetical protein